MKADRFHRQAAFAYSRPKWSMAAHIHWCRENAVDYHMFPGPGYIPADVHRWRLSW